MPNSLFPQTFCSWDQVLISHLILNIIYNKFSFVVPTKHPGYPIRLPDFSSQLRSSNRDGAIFKEILYLKSTHLSVLVSPQHPRQPIIFLPDLGNSSRQFFVIPIDFYSALLFADSDSGYSGRVVFNLRLNEGHIMPFL